MAATNSTRTNHGMTGTPEHKIWMGIKCRCKCPSATGYYRYGGRAITVSDEWRESFAAFYRDMGPRPTPKHTVERIENDKGYSKDNCCWATRKEQMRNMSRNHEITFDGRTQCLQEWADEVGLNKATLRKRLRRGWSVEKALGQSARDQSERLLEFKGATRNVTEWAKALGMSATTLYTRLNSGWSVERALTTTVT